jgi:dTMP kinase
MEYHNQVRQGYLEIAKREPGRVIVIDGSQPKEAIFEIVRSKVEELLGM